MFLPAKSEGFPKVILESASSGIPSIVYNTYGASNWMKHRENGFIVNDFDEVKGIVNELLNNAKLLQSISENTKELANEYNWKNVIKDWEKVIVNLYNGK
jgi:glycosyltransferase involved in cell wall biosynthesis